MNLEKQMYSLHGIASDLITEMKQQRSQSVTHNNHQRPAMSPDFIQSMMPFLNQGLDNLVVNKCTQDEDEEDEDEKEDEDEVASDDSEEVINLGETITLDQVGIIEEYSTTTEPTALDESIQTFNSPEEASPTSPLDSLHISTDSASVITAEDISKQDYKKLQVNRLREIVVEKGLAPASNKLKKEELLKLLTE